MQDYALYASSVEKFKLSSSKKVVRELERTSDEEYKKYAKDIYNEFGDLVSKDEFYAKIGKDKSQKAKDAKNPFNYVTNLVKTTTSSAPVSNKDYYDNLIEDANEKYKQSGLWKKAPIGSASFATTESGTGISMSGAQSIIVYPNLISSKGANEYQSVIQELKSQDLGADGQFTFSSTGARLNSKNKDNIRSLMNKVIMENGNNDSKLNGLVLSAMPIAMGDYKKDAMNFRFPDEFLSDNTFSFDKSGNKKGDGIISPDEYNELSANGLTIIADDGTFNNSLIRSFSNDILKSYVDNGEPYVYTSPYSLNPDSNKKDILTIKKNKLTKGYDVTSSISIFDPETGEYFVQKSSAIDAIPESKNLTKYRDKIKSDVFYGSYLNNLKNSYIQANQ
jgi:hypothetical protein